MGSRGIPKLPNIPSPKVPTHCGQKTDRGEDSYQ